MGTWAHRPTISLCCPCVLCLLRRLSSSPPHRSKHQGCSFYILVLLETKLRNTSERKLRNLENLPHFWQFLYNKKKTMTEKISRSRFWQKKKKRGKKIPLPLFWKKKKKKKKKK